jgi:hypothetical protein
MALHARTVSQAYSGWPTGTRSASSWRRRRHPGARQRRHLGGRRRDPHGRADRLRRGRGRPRLPGRPWLFRDLAAAFAGYKGCQEIRKHIAWYCKGFSVAGPTRLALAHVSSLAELDALLATIDGDQPFNTAILGSPRGRTNAAKRVALPDGWLDDPDEDVVPWAADVMHSGG